MKNIISIKPFKDFYMNCILNNYFSTLTFLDESYRIAAFINSYSYCVYDFKTVDIHFIRVHFKYPFKNLLNKNLITDDYYYFNNNDNFIKEIKEFIISGKPVYLYVDLFNWIPDNVAWQTHHWNHFSLIVGFDDDKKVFYAIDDDAKGCIDIREIPEERVIKSFKGSDFFTGEWEMSIKSPCKIINYPKCIEPYKIDLNEIVTNTQNIIEAIKVLEHTGLWDFLPHYNLNLNADIGIAELNIMYNRHIGNKLLLNELFKEKMIKSDDYTYLDTSITNIINNWDITKRILIKAKRKNTLLQIKDSLNSICDKNFNDESVFWSDFLKSI